MTTVNLDAIAKALAEYEKYIAEDAQTGYPYWSSRISEEYAGTFADALSALVAVARAAKAVSEQFHVDFGGVINAESMCVGCIPNYDNGMWGHHPKCIVKALEDALKAIE